MSLALVQLFAVSIAVDGVVLADRDESGAISDADEPVAGALVFWETDVVATTDGDGRFHLDAPGPGIVWVRTPEGFAPGPVWRAVAEGGGEIALLLRPMAATGPLRFVHASDTHVGTNSEQETRRALQQAAGAIPPPWFLVVTGDITAGTQASEFAALAAALRDVPVPFVPVVGNHDWHDDGISYRRRLGPPMHSFDAGGVHFIALNFMASVEAQLGFVNRDLAARRAAGPLVVLTHATPSNEMARELARRGVDYLFTGHSHDNRVMKRGRLVEVNTQTAVMGGIDYTPAGYRLVELRGQRFSLEHHTVVREPLVAVSYPRPGDCVPPGRISVIAAVELGSAPDAVEYSLDGAPRVRLAPAGGWAYAGEATLSGSRWHTIDVQAWRGGKSVHASSRFCVIEAEATRSADAALPDWPMLQGSAEHRGFVDAELSPPLRPIWARAIGGHARAGGPVLAGGRLFVPVVDLSDSRHGGLVAFDARRGDRLWQRRGIGSVAATPAVAGDTVVFTTTDGWLHAHRVDDGRERWKVDLAAGQEEELSALYAAPVVAGGRVYAGNQRRFAAVDLETGAVLAGVQAASIWSHLYSSPAVASGRVIVPLGRGPSSLLALDTGDLSQRWARSYRAFNPHPLVAGRRRRHRLLRQRRGGPERDRHRHGRGALDRAALRRLVAVEPGHAGAGPRSAAAAHAAALSLRCRGGQRRGGVEAGHRPEPHPPGRVPPRGARLSGLAGGDRSHRVGRRGRRRAARARRARRRRALADRSRLGHRGRAGAVRRPPVRRHLRRDGARAQRRTGRDAARPARSRVVALPLVLGDRGAARAGRRRGPAPPPGPVARLNRATSRASGSCHRVVTQPPSH